MNVIVILCDTLRRDHVGAYSNGRALCEVSGPQAPDWAVPTPAMDRLARRGVVFENCYCGSTPCMPARRDIYTGRFEFLERGWGPLEEDDLDLPRQVSGPPNRSIQRMMREGTPVSYLLSDHFHLWEQGAGNYHMGYSGFDFVRGCEADGFHTDPVEFDCPEVDRLSKNERHWRNVHFIRHREGDYFCAQVFERASRWLEGNHAHKNFYLHLDIFDPHEPWDPPEDILRMFDPKGYAVSGLGAAPAYAPWERRYTPEQFHALRARYAAKVVFLDRWMGRFFDTMDRLGLWDNTLVILTTDHGTYNGDRGLMGKLQTHQFPSVAHIPFIAACPGVAGGQRRSQFVQLVDLYPTVLAATGRPLPAMPAERPLHGVNLLDALADPAARTRDVLLAGWFGRSVTISDGQWTLHQQPARESGQPLYWQGYCLARFQPYDLGPYENGRRAVRQIDRLPGPTWLSRKADDPREEINLADQCPEALLAMQHKLRRALIDLQAPAWQLERLGLADRTP